MSRVYEVMFIVRPDVAEEDLDKLIAGFSTTVTNGGGVVKSAEKQGRRKLAYTVRKFQEGIYILAFVEGPGSVLKELERRLRVQELVIKFITVRTDEEEKRLAKVKKLRDAKVKGQGTQGQAAAAAAAQAAENAAVLAAQAAEHAAPAAAPAAEPAPAETPMEVPPATV